MTLHIGKIIHEKVKLSKCSVKEIAKYINRSENTMYDIYKRESIDTGLLLKLSEILEFNFFELFNNEEPIRTMHSHQMANFVHAIDELKEQIALKDEHIRSLKEIILSQKEAKEKTKD